MMHFTSWASPTRKKQEQGPHQHSHHHAAEPLWDRGGGPRKLSSRANQCEERKPLKENREKGSRKPENHDQAEEIRLQETALSQLGLCCFHGFGKSETLEKNCWVYSKQDVHWWIMFCLDVQNIACFAMLSSKDKAAEMVRSTQSPTVEK